MVAGITRPRQNVEMTQATNHAAELIGGFTDSGVAKSHEHA